MSGLRISDVARQAGLQASAIRYYEQIGLLPKPERESGQRRYDEAALYRLALIQRARQLGFTLADIRELFFGFRSVTPASERWRALSQRKLAELSDQMKSIKTMQRLLHELRTRCRCTTLEQCGRGIYRSGNITDRAKTCSANIRGCGPK
jgi:MerR family redox-sensitive transcriptional activator SoxR